VLTLENTYFELKRDQNATPCLPGLKSLERLEG
jgi:hypothetical protein